LNIVNYLNKRKMHLLITKSHAKIDAGLEKVWEVLTTPKLIRQWDDLPEDFDDGHLLKEGTEIIWTHPDGSFTKLTVTDAVEKKFLKLNLYGSKWQMPEKAYDVAYIYTMSELDKKTKLEIEIGDFSILPNGQDYFNASDEFAKVSIEKIKALAENSTKFQ
jgi:uncharacterized protein YndB with AHSA1/START domain